LPTHAIQPMIYRIPEIQEQTFYIQYSQWYTVYLKYKNKRFIYNTANDIQYTWKTRTSDDVSYRI
jgi:hypothetical protein